MRIIKVGKISLDGCLISHCQNCEAELELSFEDITTNISTFTGFTEHYFKCPCCSILTYLDGEEEEIARRIGLIR